MPTFQTTCFCDDVDGCNGSTSYKNVNDFSLLEIEFVLYWTINLVLKAENKAISKISKVQEETRLNNGKNDAYIVFFG